MNHLRSNQGHMTFKRLYLLSGASYHRQCIIRQRSCQVEKPLVLLNNIC